VSTTFWQDLPIPWLKDRLRPPPPIPADLRLINSGMSLDESGEQLEQLWFAVEEEEGGHRYRGFRVVRLLQLSFIPLDARADAGLLQKMKSVLRSLYGARIAFVHLTAGIFSAPHSGILQCYGVSAFAPDLESATAQAAEALATLQSAMAGAFRQIKLAPLERETGRWLATALAAMPHALVVVGQPDPRENAKGGSAALFNNPLTSGNDTARQYSLQQNEILFRGMATLQEDFVFLVLCAPVALAELTEMLVGLAEQTSTWAAWQSGVRGAAFGISLPAVLSGALMHSASLGSSEAEGQSHSEGLANATGLAQTAGSAHTEGTSHTHTQSHTRGESEVHTSGVAESESHAVSSGHTHTESQSTASGTIETSGTSFSQTTSRAETDSVQLGANTSARLGINAGLDAGLGGGFNGGYGHSWSQGEAETAGWTSSTGTSHSQSQGSAEAVSQAETHTTGLTRSSSTALGRSESWGSAEASSVSQSDTTSTAQTRSSSETRSSADGTQHSSALSRLTGQGTSAGLAVGVSPSLSLHQSYQWQFDPAILVTQVLRTQQRLLEGASREGAFYADAYVFARTPRGRRALMGLIPEAFHGTEDVVSGVQARSLNPDEADYIRRHAGVFSPSTRVETVPEVLSGYMDATLLTLLQLAAYTAPGMFELGPALTVQESTPDFAFYPAMAGDVILARQWSSELGEITAVPLRLTPERHFHTAFCGDTGFGKSISAERLAYETTRAWHYRTIILDFGQGWRRALNWSGLEGRVDVRQVFPGARRPLRWNILQIPRRMDPGRYRSLVAELFANAGRLGPRQLGFLRRAITEVYQDCGVLPCPEKPGFQYVQSAAEIAAIQARRAADRRPAAPVHIGTPLEALTGADLQALTVERSKRADFAEVVRRLRRTQESLGKNDQTSRTSLEGLLLRVETFEEGDLARQYGAGDDSLPIEDLGLLGPAEDPWGLVVIEGGAEMSDEFAKTAILSLLASVLYFDAVSRRRESLAGVSFPPMQIFFEEANKILSGVATGSTAADGPGTGAGGGVSEIFQTMWRDGRKYRIFLHLMVQTISTLPEGILSSCNNIFIVQTKNARDRDMVMAHIGRSEKGFVNTEYKRYLARIPIRLAVVKLGYSPDVTQLEPVLVNPLPVPGSEPSDAEIVCRLGSR